MSTASAPLQNIYYERKVGTPRSCYICRKETTTVLATLKADDFIYTCEGHLTDPASLIAPPPPPASGPSAEDIKRVISDYEARQLKKAEPKDKDKSKDKDKEKDNDDKKPAAAPAAPAIPVSPAPAPTSTHRKFALHRQIFDMRKNEIKRREMGARAKEVGKGLPQVPRGF